MKKIKTWWKFSGIFLIVTAILHTLVASILGIKAFIEWYRAGVFNSILADIAGSLGFWFFILGIPLLFFGLTLHYYIKKTKEPPHLFLGFSFLFFGIIGTILAPGSGLFLFILQGLIIVIAQR